jgi:hypothetical protein
MCWWDRKLLEKLETIGIKPFLYKRYVDDINLGTDAIEDRYDFINGELIEIEPDATNNIKKDKRTFDIIRTIGDEIHESIKLTTDVPSNNDDEKVPILDLKCWITRMTINNEMKR